MESEIEKYFSDTRATATPVPLTTQPTETKGSGNPNGTKQTETNTNGNASEVDVLKTQVDFLTTSLQTAETRAEELKF